MKKTTFHTLAELYQHSIDTFETRPCVSLYQKQQFTYAEFGSCVAYFIELFRVSGLQQGDKIALLSQNMPHWSAAYFAITTSGMVVVPILPDFSALEVRQILEHSGAKAAVISAKQLEKLPGNYRESLSLVVRCDDRVVLHQAVAETPVNYETPVAAESVAAIIYTSGTTSSPKGVMLSHRNLCSQLEMVHKLQPIEKEDVLLSILPLSHTYECTLGLLMPFMCGASVVYTDRPPVANFLLPTLQKVRPTMMLTVPLIMEKIFKSQVLGKFNSHWATRLVYRIAPGRKLLHRLAGAKLYKSFGGKLRFFGIGGSKLDPCVEQFLLEAKFPYAIGYGLTETAPLVAGTNPQKVKWQSTGLPLQGLQMRIGDPNPATGEGEILVKGPSVMLGYYKNPQATQESFTADGWFKTKDLGVLDAQGRLYIKGRLNNLILGASGENIYPEEIEHVINGHTLVVDSLVKQEKGRLVALVQFNREELEKRYDLVKEGLENKIEALKKELLLYVNARVNKFSRISLVVEHARTFEKTPTQKIKRFLYK